MIIFISQNEKICSSELVFECLRIYAKEKNIEGIDYENVKIIKDKNGKPYFDNLEIYFSVSDTAGMKIVALSKYNVGVDTECIKDIDYKRIADRFFTHNESLKVKTARDFFNIWAAKEAYSKYTSLGIASFRKFDIFKLNDVFITKLKVGRQCAAYSVSIDRTVIYYKLQTACLEKSK
jgi:phosphopantetheine--protein transferase-like protein